MNHWLPEKLKFKRRMLNFLRVMVKLGLLLFTWHPQPEGSTARWVTQLGTDGEFGRNPLTLWVFWCTSSLDVPLSLQNPTIFHFRMFKFMVIAKRKCSTPGSPGAGQRSSPLGLLGTLFLYFCVQRSGLLHHQLHGKNPSNITNLNCSYLCSDHMPKCIFSS